MRHRDLGGILWVYSVLCTEQLPWYRTVLCSLYSEHPRPIPSKRSIPCNQVMNQRIAYSILRTRYSILGTRYSIHATRPTISYHIIRYHTIPYQYHTNTIPTSPTVPYPIFHRQATRLLFPTTRPCSRCGSKQSSSWLARSPKQSRDHIWPSSERGTKGKKIREKGGWDGMHARFYEYAFLLFGWGWWWEMVGMGELLWERWKWWDGGTERLRPA